MNNEPYEGMTVNYVTLLYPFSITKQNSKRKNTRKYWKVRCICGKELDARRERLVGRGRKMKSCGCKHSYDHLITHHLGHTRLYTIYSGMKERCLKETSKSWDRYGGRGIKISDEWLNDFVSFYDWSLANGYSDDLSIDRIDNDKGYYPENCRWVDKKTQSRNLRTNKLIEINGETKTVIEWCETLGISKNTVYARIRNHGWSHEKALLEPIRGSN